ncbi:MAG: hypothetical protein HY652_11180, partial [Acidobacteria bacterium]|nr:hypothetical protein [Acidobacteriota bacterium]
TSGVQGDQTLGRVKFNRFTEHYEIFAEHLYIGDDFRHDIGFVQRRGIRRSDGIVTLDPRPDVFNIRKISIRSELTYLTDTRNRLLSRLQNLQVRTHFQTGAMVGFAVNNHYERLERNFHITPEVTIPVGEYRFPDFALEFNGRPESVLVPRGSVEVSESFTAARGSLLS